MADIKAGDKKEEKKPQDTSSVSWEEIILLVFGILALLFVFVPRFITHKENINTDNTNTDLNVKNIYQNIFVNNDETINQNRQPSIIDETSYRVKDFFNFLAIIIFSLIIFLILLYSIIIYYNKFRRELIINSYKKKFETEEEIKAEEKLEELNEKILENLAPDTNGLINPRWEIVMKYFNSANQSDWKLAILEADIMLYEVLDKSGFRGESIGEMLKNADRSKLNSVDDAWSAHKVRNEIAHSGTDYQLSRMMVEKTITQFEKVFNELGFI